MLMMAGHRRSTAAWPDGKLPHTLVTFLSRTLARGSLTLELPDRHIYTLAYFPTWPCGVHGPRFAMGARTREGGNRGWFQSASFEVIV